MSVPAHPNFVLLSSPDWTDYELLDTGGGARLERYGPYRFVRPESQAVWQPALPKHDWESAHMVFQGDDGDAKGWQTLKPIESRWTMRYKRMSFWVQPTPFRHMGVFPEQANHWDWIGAQVAAARPAACRVLNLFGYTGLASLAAAAAGASVTHVDASKKAVTWARDNQKLSDLADRPIRWMVDDAMKFIKRELRRGARYDGIVMDPPKFGRGPKGELWKLEESLPELLQICRDLLTPTPLFIVLTIYAFRASALSLRNALAEMTAELGGDIAAGETTLTEKSAGRILSTAVFARWSSDLSRRTG